MLAEERRRQILNLVKDRGGISVKELAGLFDVSEMTVHRDLNRLAEDGSIEKTFGGALAPRDSRPVATADQEEGHPSAPASAAEATCSLCAGDTPSNTRFVILRQDGSRLAACCPHCGLIILRRLAREEAHALATDFITSRTIDAAQAHYLLAADATPCCSPSILTFGRREDAERFARGFGGRVVDFSIASSGFGDEPACAH